MKLHVTLTNLDELSGFVTTASIVAILPFTTLAGADKEDMNVLAAGSTANVPPTWVWFTSNEQSDLMERPSIQLYVHVPSLSGMNGTV